MSTEYPINILIAEDEPIILNNIAKKAAKAGSWVQICGKAESGNEALSILQEHSVDILITDIEMPGINGLELSKIVREQYPAVKVVILSGYSNFEYARTAVHYGVHEYLLKPVPQETFTELLCRLKEEIITERTSRRREVLTRALAGAPTEPQIPSSVEGESFYLLYLILGNYEARHLPQETLLERLALWDRFSLDTALYQAPGLKHTWLIDETYRMSKFLILHTEKGRLSAGYLRLILQQYLADVFPDTPWLLLLYPEPISYPEIWASAKELRKAAAQCACPFAQEAFILEPQLAGRTPDLASRTQISDLLRSLSGSSAFLSCARTAVEEYLQNHYSSKELFSLIEELFSTAQAAFLPEEALVQEKLSCVFAAFYSLSEETRFTELLLQQLSALTGKGNGLSSSEQLCETIVRYIQNHYCSKLSLNDLALHFGYTPSYINRIFKKKLGISPVQYITNMKMEKARALLASKTPMDIRDIASAVGYDDARYFSRVFKNETGMTPTAWANKIP